MLLFPRKEEINMNKKIKGACTVVLSLTLLAPTVSTCLAEVVEQEEEIIQPREFIPMPNI